MSKNKQPAKDRVRPPARPSHEFRIHPACVDAAEFDIDMDEGSRARGRLDPDDTASVTVSDGLGREATLWTVRPRQLRLLITCLTEIAVCLEGNL